MPMPLNERIGAGIPPGTLDYHTLSAYWPAQIPRDAALQFAKDLADGWLAELSDWLDARRKADEQATEVINNAKQTWDNYHANTIQRTRSADSRTAGVALPQPREAAGRGRGETTRGGDTRGETRNGGTREGGG